MNLGDLNIVQVCGLGVLAILALGVIGVVFQELGDDIPVIWRGLIALLTLPAILLVGQWWANESRDPEAIMVATQEALDKKFSKDLEEIYWSDIATQSAIEERSEDYGESLIESHEATADAAQEAERAEASLCQNGCATPPPGCDIKGNISFDSGERIYHMPGQEYYSATEIRPEYGERWFCTADEAEDAGWRRALK